MQVQLVGSALVSNDLAVEAATFLVDARGGVTTLYVAGDLDLNTLEALAGSLEHAVQETVTEMVVDLSACGFLCSRSLGLIETAAIELQERQARLVVRLQPHSFDLISRSVGTYAFDAV